MNIAIDIRSLQSRYYSGVETYTQNIIEELLRLDKHNHYTFFYNSIRGQDFSRLHFINASVININIPSKALHLATNLFNIPIFNRILKNQDLVFFPNLNFFHTSLPIKMVLTIHDLSAFINPTYFDFKRRIWHKALRLKRRILQADKLIAVSQFTKDDCMGWFKVPTDKLEVIYPGIKPSQGDFGESNLRRIRNEYGLPGEYLLFISTLEPRKNLLNIIEAFEAIKSRAHLVILGKPGWKFRPILKKITSSPKRRFIHYLGFVSETDKSGIIKLARGMVYPSFYEGFGFVALESLSLNVPVLTAQYTSLPEIVGQSSLLVDPYNSQNIAAGMMTLLNDEEWRTQALKLGSEVIKRYSWKKAAAEHLRVFTQLANRPA